MQNFNPTERLIKIEQEKLEIMLDDILITAAGLHSLNLNYFINSPKVSPAVKKLIRGEINYNEVSQLIKDISKSKKVDDIVALGCWQKMNVTPTDLGKREQDLLTTIKETIGSNSEQFLFKFLFGKETISEEQKEKILNSEDLEDVYASTGV